LSRECYVELVAYIGSHMATPSLLNNDTLRD